MRFANACFESMFCQHIQQTTAVEKIICQDVNFFWDKIATKLQFTKKKKKLRVNVLVKI